MTDQPDLDFTPQLFTVCEEVSKEKLREQYPEAHARRTGPDIKADNPEIVKMFTPAHARATDPQTSHAAARRITNSQKVRAHIEYLFRNLGRMHDESLIVNYLASSSNLRPHATEQSIRSRRKELVDRNVLRDSGEKKLTRAGNPSTVWEIVKS